MVIQQISEYNILRKDDYYNTKGQKNERNFSRPKLEKYQKTTGSVRVPAMMFKFKVASKMSAPWGSI